MALSFANLAGVFLTLVALGGLGEWTGTQFVGVFGIFEIATGLAFIVCPNIWRLPVAEADTPDRTSITLAADTATTPHWAAGVKVIAGAGMVIYAGVAEGLSFASVGILPYAIAVAIFIIALSVAAARWGVAYPERDVVRMVLRRPNRDDFEMPGVSLTAAFLQVVLGAFTLPAIKVLSPDAFFAPEIAPAPWLLIGTIVITAASCLAAAWAWRGRIVRRAPRVQREAEEAL